jgi:glycosyltransferase involved in cell wall biosynthesis
MKVVLWGTYDVGKPRTRLLRAALDAAGVEVVEIHRDLWRGIEDKSRVGRRAGLRLGLRWALAYPSLVWRYLRAPRHEVAIVAYLGQVDVLVLWPFARARRARLLWDMFIPLHETIVEDRRLVSPSGVAARLVRRLEWLGCRAADRVLLDTGPHARAVEDLLAPPQGRVGWVPVGAEPAHFPRLPAAPRGRRPLRILFYGQLIPLHGIETILAAAATERGRTHRWSIIGSGQDEPVVASFIETVRPEHVTWERWVAYEALHRRIGDADICLGIFGTSGKAASVVPNKAYQVLSVGRSLVTRDSPAMRELVGPGVPGVALVSPSDPAALLDAIDALAAEGCPQPPAALRAAFSPEAIGARLAAELAVLASPIR